MGMDKTQGASSKSIWLKVWHFPLVAMGAALALAIGAAVLSRLISTHILQPNMSEDGALIAGVFVLIALCMAAYKLGIRHLGAKKHDDLPLDAKALRDTVLGIGGGAALISICVGLAALAGTYRIKGAGSFSDWATIIFLAGIYAGFFEELLLRGIIFRWLEELTGSWIALALSALLFGFGHAGNDNATLFSSLAIALEAGILLGAAYMLTRSLWLAIGLHAGWNVVQALWDVPVSGNDFDGLASATIEGPPLLAGAGFGLEATIFAVVVATGAGIWMAVKAARMGRVVKPMWSRKGAAITAY